MRQRSRFRNLALLAVAMAGNAAAVSGWAEPYPARAIRMIIPSAPASTGDSIARLLAERLGNVLHTPVVVENRPGASGIIGSELAMRVPADGYALLFATSATHVIASFAMGTRDVCAGLRG